ncbi:CRISPR locus-related DNA-binding protein [Candidatus Micrarchaeota archaeon]|nr:CRISPR locus-related DNA-binding protein [Candidatus Micrarchaeota archaeon]
MSDKYLNIVIDDETMGETKTLISTLYAAEPVVPSIHKFSPQKLILLTDEKPDEKAKKSINAIKDMFSNVMKIEIAYVKQYDIYSIAKKTVDIIESEKENEIFINITGGRKTLMLGVIYGAYARSEMIKSIHYSTEENNEFIELPLMSYDLNEVEHVLLETINEKGTIKVNSLAEDLGKTRGLLYQYLKRLRMKGLVDSQFRITQAGKVALL